MRRQNDIGHKVEVLLEGHKKICEMFLIAKKRQK